jgi:hypothetical protein
MEFVHLIKVVEHVVVDHRKPLRAAWHYRPAAAPASANHA